jgi:hypothetical protein
MLAARLAAGGVGALAGGALGALLHPAITAAPLLSAALAGLLAGLLVLGWRLQIARGAAAASTIGLVPAVIAGLVVLTLMPLLHAGAEIVIARASVAQFVERQVGFSSSLVAVEGFAVLREFDEWVLLRDALDSRRMALLRTRSGIEPFRRRSVVGRATHDPAAVEAAAEALRARGEQVGQPVPRLLAVPPPAADVDPDRARELDSVEALASVQPDALVRLELRFTGEGVASCRPEAGCDPRRLGAGRGFWDQLAEDADGQRVIVRTPYPPDVAPVLVYGRQTADPGEVSRFAELPWIRLQTGWARLLRGAIVDQDPDLPVNRLWLGPILFGIGAALLWLGRRSGYPVFVPEPAPAGPPHAAPAEVRATASGRVAPPGRSPVDLDETPVVLHSHGDEIDIRVEQAAGLEVRVPRGLGALSGVEPGELRYLTSRRPVLHVGWYGSQVRLAFATADERDAALALLRPGGGQAGRDDADEG